MRAKTGALTERILGVDFFAGTLDEAVAHAVSGGLVVAPSGPGLGWDLPKVPEYRAALEGADLVLTDSGFLTWLWLLRTGRRVPRHSGLAFLRRFLESEAARREAAFWVMPSEEEKARTMVWLRGQGLPVVEENFVVAPRYGLGELKDEALVASIEQRRTQVVVLAIGGGVQERLGWYLRNALSYRPGIFCIGAAIAFLTGGQVHIPPWVDRARLGWLWRTVANPRSFGPRYGRALPLAKLVFSHREKSPAGTAN